MAGWMSKSIRALSAVDVILLLATLLHYSRDAAYWRALNKGWSDEHTVREQWERQLEEVRHLSAKAVSRSAQLQQSRGEVASHTAAAGCPPLKPCPKVKPCPKPGNQADALAVAKLAAMQAKAQRDRAALSSGEGSGDAQPTPVSSYGTSSAAVTATAIVDAEQRAAVEVTASPNPGNPGNLAAAHSVASVAGYEARSPGPAAPFADPSKNDGVDFKAGLSQLGRHARSVPVCTELAASSPCLALDQLVIKHSLVVFTGLCSEVYVYDLPEQFHRQLAKEQRRCLFDQYGTEIRIHEVGPAA